MPQSNAVRAAGIVRDAGGSIVGRTKLQKIGYLLHAAGYESGLRFSYRHYGPFSEDLAVGAKEASLLGWMKENEQQASWGGFYSTYTFVGLPNDSIEAASKARTQLITESSQADAVDLELAATAVFLFKEGFREPWSETARRKPEKAESGRLDRARNLYQRLSSIKTLVELPKVL